MEEGVKNGVALCSNGMLWKVLLLDFCLTAVSHLPLLVSNHRKHHMFLPWKIIHEILWKVFWNY